MPNKASAKKELRKAGKLQAANNAVKKAYKMALKDVLKGIEAGDKDILAKAQFAQKKLDKASKKGVIKKNTASRRMSRLMAKVNAVAKK